MNRRKLLTCLVAVMVLFMTTFSVPTVKADTLTDLQKKSQQLKKEAEKLQNQIKQQENNLNNQKVYKETLDKKIANTIKQIDNLEAQISTLDKELSSLNYDIREKEEQIAQKEKEIENEFQTLRIKLRTLSQTGNMTTLQMLLNEDNYVDYLIKSTIMERESKATKDLMDKLEKELKEINKQKEETEQNKTQVEKQRQTVANLRAEANNQKKELDVLYAKSNQALKNLQNSLSTYKDELQKTKEEQEKLEREIARIIAQNSSNSKYGGGTMYWPVPTVRAISSYYGMRWGTLHKGIDIANGPIPIYGENVVATASGKVIYANSTNTWGSGYGYYVIVDHGRDSKGRTISTLYAHLSKVSVTYGQTVVGGQTVIGKAGATGNVTGPHLHFEVRVNGTPVDPIANGYLKL